MAAQLVLRARGDCEVGVALGAGHHGGTVQPAANKLTLEALHAHALVHRVLVEAQQAPARFGEDVLAVDLAWVVVVVGGGGEVVQAARHTSNGC